MDMRTPLEPMTRRYDPERCRSCAAFARALETLNTAGVPYLVGGGFAVEVFLGAPRAKIKDLDLFLRPFDLNVALESLRANGFSTKLHEPQWLAKAYDGDDFVDLIFATRNGLLDVDDHSFERAPHHEVLGHPVRVQPVEEVIATKLFVAARDRFDVSDVAHLFLWCSDRIDWKRLIDRLAPHIEILHVYLLLFQYIYPGRRDVVPSWVYKLVAKRARLEREKPHDVNASRGIALDPEAFAVDIQRWGFFDTSGAADVAGQRTEHHDSPQSTGCRHVRAAPPDDDDDDPKRDAA
jgi:hypothetical protein